MVISVNELNSRVSGQSAESIIKAVIAEDSNVFVSTNFGPYSAVLLHMLSQIKPDIAVVWIDSGLNKPETYKYAEAIIDRLNLNVSIYTPSVTAARLNAVMGGIPDIQDENHPEFTKQFKLEPFERAMAENANKVWFSAVRREQTAFRAGMSYVANGPFELVKVSPLLDWVQRDMDEYLDLHDLPNEINYFDPTKAQGHRECGLHTLKSAL